jgi:hypothetical protein
MPSAHKRVNRAARRSVALDFLKQNVELCYVMLRYVILSYVMLFYFMLCYAKLRYATLCYFVMLCCVTLCYVTVCYVVMLCYVMLCYVMLCYVMLCYVMLCYVMLCYVMLTTFKNGGFCPRNVFSEFCSLLTDISDSFPEYKETSGFIMDIRHAYCERGTGFLCIILFNSMLQWVTERRSSKILSLSVPKLANCIGYIYWKNWKCISIHFYAVSIYM